jgi:hypothetical protein
MPRRAFKQVPLTNGAAVIVINRADRRRRLSLVPSTAVTVWIGDSENITNATGYPCTQSLPFPSCLHNLDVTQELWCYATAAGLYLSVYEEFYTEQEWDAMP